jgi:branched-chain amino acid transport system permease protein
MIAFLLVNFGTALVGLLYLPITGFVGPSSFGVDLSIMLFFAVIVGGQGNIAGPVFGVWILYLVPNVLFETLPNFRLLIYGVVTLVVMLLLPRGVLGTIRHALESRRTRQTPPPLPIGELLEGRRSSALQPSDSCSPAIVVQGGSKRFGRVAALEQVTLTVRVGTIHGLVGLNGSGKTTLLNVLSGLTKLSAGTVTINGIDCTRQAAYRIARLGLGRTFQTPRIFTALTLWENLLVGADAARGHALTGAARRERWPDTPVDWLPHGQRRLLEVARIALKEADTLLFDEPAAGLSPEERNEFAALMRHLRDAMRCTIVLVEHDLDLVWSVADHITVLETGRIVADGAPAEIAGLAAVNALFVEPPDA